MNPLIVKIIISILGLFGFCIAMYIHRKKITKKKLICPARASCEFVVHSDYSKIFGIQIEHLGIVYYGVICLSYLTMVVAQSFGSFGVVSILLVMTGVAFAFSLYLLGVQAFRLKQWCSWCVVSAIISASIFIFSIINLSF